jgi:Arc/MetJ-type ribon-helix-helix transcriptional regulator
MTVVLNEQTQGLLELGMAMGSYASPDEAVNAILQEHLANAIDLEALKESLRVSMQQPRIPYREGMLVERLEKLLEREGLK